MGFLIFFVFCVGVLVVELERERAMKNFAMTYSNFSLSSGFQRIMCLPPRSFRSMEGKVLQFFLCVFAIHLGSLLSFIKKRRASWVEY